MSHIYIVGNVLIELSIYVFILPIASGGICLLRAS